MTPWEKWNHAESGKQKAEGREQEDGKEISSSAKEGFPQDTGLGRLVVLVILVLKKLGGKS